MDKNEFETLLKEDNEVRHQELFAEYEVSRDYDKFREYYASSFDNAMETITELARLHKQHGHEFDIRELGDEIQ